MTTFPACLLNGTEYDPTSSPHSFETKALTNLESCNTISGPIKDTIATIPSAAEMAAIAAVSHSAQAIVHLDAYGAETQTTAASGLLAGSMPTPPSTTRLIISPYTGPQHTLDLDALPTPVRLFALALTTLVPVREDYATASYLESFNWDEVFRNLRALATEAGIEWQPQEFYVVIFRSTLKEGIDREWLGKLDKESHREACASGGLLKYWFGVCDDKRRNLATCIWRNREDAKAGGRGPWHARARAAAGEMYEHITFFTYRFVIKDRAERWWLEQLS